jgi:predicted Zn-dependent peptidase
MSQKLEVIYNSKQLFHIFVYVPAGSIYEDREKAGISHLLEHMLFKHTKKYHEKELLEEITVLGGSYNAITDRDATFYYIMTHMDNYKKAIEIMHEITRRPVFNAKELELEKKVVLEELNKHLDNNSMFFNLSYLAILDVNNKYVFPVAGTIKTIKKISVSDLEKYFDERYKDIVITINYDKKYNVDLEKYTMQKFGKVDSFSLTTFKELYDVNSHMFKSNIIVLQDNSYQYTTHILFPSFPREMMRDNIILNFIRFCLASSGLYGILTYELRSKRGLVYNVSSMCESYRYIGMFRLIISTTNADTVKIITTILDSLEKLKTSGISPKLLGYYKKGFLNQQKYALTNDSFRTILHSELFFYETDIDDTEYLEIVNSITVDDVISVSKNIFDFNKIGICTYGPYKSINSFKKRVFTAVSRYTKTLNSE